MSWLNHPPQRRNLAQQLSLQPLLYAKYQRFLDSLQDEARVPLRVLELCRMRVAAIHECEEQWQLRLQEQALSEAELADLQRGICSGFTELEQAALSIAELLPHNHHDITDAQVQNIKNQLGEAGAIALLTAIAFFDVNARLSRTLGTSNP